MQLIKKILLAQDFRESSENVVSTAIELAKIFKSEIITSHILPDDMVNEKVKALLNEAALIKLEKTVDLIKSEGVKAGSPILEYGVPHESIVKAADDIDANLILIGSGETQKGEKFLLGSTTKRIIQKSEKPVFVVKEGVSLNVQHILCPVDFSSTSKRALKNAITMAHRFKAELTILSVCQLHDALWFASDKNTEIENENRCAGHRVKFDIFLEGFNLSGLKWKKEIRKGDPANEILNTISEKMIDLLVMGTTGKTGINRLVIGSVAEKVVRVVPCSFLTLKSEDIIKLQLESDISSIENHYKTAMQLLEDGFYNESIDHFKHCLSINGMYAPSHFGMAKVYEKMNKPKKAEIYRKSGREIMDRLWYSKIEEEARKYQGR
jgi:nucleotide-binding universal stress UspA family protein